MSTPKWQTSLVALGLDPGTGHAVLVVLGLVDTAAGGVRVALQVGGHEPVIMALHDANQVVLNVNETTAEQLRVAGERLGDGEW